MGEDGAAEPGSCFIDTAPEVVEADSGLKVHTPLDVYAVAGLLQFLYTYQREPSATGKESATEEPISTSITPRSIPTQLELAEVTSTEATSAEAAAAEAAAAEAAAAEAAAAEAAAAEAAAAGSTPKGGAVSTAFDDAVDTAHNNCYLFAIEACQVRNPEERPSAAQLSGFFRLAASGGALPHLKPSGTLKFDGGSSTHSGGNAIVVAPDPAQAAAVEAAYRALDAAWRALPIKLRLPVTRGPHGFGLGVDASNIVHTLTPGGQAEADQMLRLGDQVLAVNGVALLGRGLSEVLKLNMSEYSFVVARTDEAYAASLAQCPDDATVRCVDGALTPITFKLPRDQLGFGFDLSAANIVRGIVSGSLAADHELMHVDDLIVEVDGEKLGDRRLGEVINLEASEVAFTVLRASESESRSESRTVTTGRLVAKPKEGVLSMVGAADDTADDEQAGINAELQSHQIRRTAGDITAAAAVRAHRAAKNAAAERRRRLSEMPSDSELLAFVLELQGLKHEDAVALYRGLDKVAPGDENCADAAVLERYRAAPDEAVTVEVAEASGGEGDDEEMQEVSMWPASSLCEQGRVQAESLLPSRVAAGVANHIDDMDLGLDEEEDRDTAVAAATAVAAVAAAATKAVAAAAIFMAADREGEGEGESGGEGEGEGVVTEEDREQV